MKDEVVNQVNNLDTNDYSIIVHSIPDVAQTDQQAIVVQYYYERFGAFLPVENHSSMTLFSEITQFWRKQSFHLKIFMVSHMVMLPT